MTEENPSLHNLLGKVRLIDIVADFDSFENWFESEGDVVDFDEIIQGYQLLLEASIRLLPDHLNTVGEHIGLDTNREYRWALASGVEINEIPNSCRLAIFSRNVNEVRRELLRTDSKTALRAITERIQEEVLRPFWILSEEYVVEPEGVDRDRVVNQFARRHALPQLTQMRQITSGGNRYPEGLHLGPFNVWTDDEHRLNDAFIGYKEGIRYLWQTLVSGDEYNSSTFSELDSATSWDDIDHVYMNTDEDDLIPLCQPWNKESNRLELQEKPPIDIFGPLVEDSDSDLDEESKLAAKLYWHDAYFVDSTPRVWKGASGFVTTLYGIREMNSRSRHNEIHVCRFKHPANYVPSDRETYDYTYGILVSDISSSSTTHYRQIFSGWVMFYDCCNDFSGYGSSQFRMAERAINAIDECEVNLREMEIDREDFKNYMAPRSISSDLERRLTVQEQMKTEREKLRNGKGRLLELMAYYVFSRNDDVEVEWNIEYGTQNEIDLRVERDDSVAVLECKSDPSTIDIDDELQKLQEKVNSITTDKERTGKFCFWSEPYTTTIEAIEQEASIEYIVLGDSEILEDKTIHDIDHIMEKASWRAT